jgi:hypothetical protein
MDGLKAVPFNITLGGPVDTAEQAAEKTLVL